MLFTKLGRKIIRDAERANSRSEVKAIVDDDDADDSFQRYKGDMRCEDSSDVYYHGGGHHHHDDDGLDDDAKYEKAMYQLKCVTCVGLVFVSAQGCGAYMANSIAIATDCAHLATDLVAFIIGIVALALTRRGESDKYTWGWHRSEIIGSIISIIFLLVLTICLLIEAIKRIYMKYDIKGEIMLITAILSLFFNLILIKILHQDHDHGDEGHSHGHGHGHGHSHGEEKHGHGEEHGHGKKEEHGHGHEKKDDGHGHGETADGHGHDNEKKDDGHGHGHGKTADKKISAIADDTVDHDLIQTQKNVAKAQSQNINVTAAYLHILGDLLLSVGVVISSCVIYYFPTKEYTWSKYFDPLCTLIFSLVICYTCKDTLTESVFVLMEGAPNEVKTAGLRKKLVSIEGVNKLEAFHCWSLSRGKYAMSCQIECSGNSQEILEKALKVAKEYKIKFPTIQVKETQGHTEEEEHHHDH